MGTFPFSVNAVILAAGLSRRMGRSKLVIPVFGTPVIRWVADAAIGSRIEHIVLVLGHEAADVKPSLADILDDHRIRVVVNSRPEEGMSSSLKVGLKALDRSCAGILILLGDQPGISSDVINSLAETFQQASDRIVCPTVRGRRTTPVIIPKDLFPALMTTTGDVGGREVLHNNNERILYVELGEQYDDFDLDTPEDLKRLSSLRYFRGERHYQ